MNSQSSKRRPPPNYFSRRVQVRLLILVAAFMLVVVLMQKAGDPRTWQWMFPPQPSARQAPTGAGQAQPASDPPADAYGGQLAEESAAPDTRLPPQPPDRELPPGTIRTTTPLADVNLSDHDPQTRTELDGWNRLLSELGRESDQTLRRGLLAARHARPLDAETLSQWPELMTRLDAGWSAYLDRALTSLVEDLGGHNEDAGGLAEGAAGLKARQREKWLEVLQSCRGQWQDRLRPALQALGGAEALNSEHRAALEHLQTLLDQLAMARVKDNTVLRTAETDAWFRLLERLQASPPQQLNDASTGPVGYLQLFKQPEVYRGQLVTIRGTARLAYRVQAPRNMYGITGYTIFWVKPRGGPNSPFVVYSLETPDGFPPIKDKDLDRETTPLNEDVEFTGYFFKRWAYRARDGAQTAPLMLARVPVWHRPARLAGFQDGVPPYWFLGLAVGLSVIVAAGLTWFVYRHSRQASRFELPRLEREATPQRLQKLAEEDHPTPMEATLRTLAEEDPGPSRPPR